MATAEQYADWIVKNQDKQGTPEFETVAAAYKALRQNEPLAARVGREIMDVPRQVGLTVRYGMEATGQNLGVFTEPFRQIVVNPLMGALGLPSAQSTGDAASSLADKFGLPMPRDANERAIGDATRTGLSAIGFGAAAKKAAGVLGDGVSKQVAEAMASRPVLQTISAAGAGGAGGAVREAGGGPVAQFVAALGGGVASGAALNKATSVASAGKQVARQLMTPKMEQVTAADQAIELILSRSGIDWRAVPLGIKNGLRDEVAHALNTGQPLNEAAVRRLAVFRMTGTTPTVGMLTQNPGQITREMNLAKTGANSTDKALQRLPEIYNSNIAQLLKQLDEAGAAGAPDAATTGARAIGGLAGRAKGERSRIDALYDAARDSQGRSLPLEGGTFTTRANQLLDEAMVGGALPADVANKLNAIARGEMPLTVEIAEQLKTRIGNLQRGTSDGSARMALGLVRKALDETPLFNPRVNPGNLQAAPGTVPPSTQGVGEQAIEAFNRARSANRAYMQTLEANPALAAVDDAISALKSNPQLRSVNDIVGNGQFVEKFVFGNASPGEVRSLLQQIGPQGAQAMRQYVARFLKDAATNSTDDITKFSNAAYRSALRDIGDEKLAVLFTKPEIDKLKAIGDAGKYIQAQPAGSAVNNSNSGALVLGRGLDLLDTIAGYVPLGGRDIIRGRIQGAQQSMVLDPRNALLDFVPQRSAPFRINPLIAATVPATVQGRQEDRGY